jgi:hemerythrin superfamily protein
MKATDLLKKQHKDVKGLFKKIEKTENGRERRQLMEQIGQQLELHTRLEEEIFYPAVREVSRKAAEMVDEAFEEHHVVDLVLKELPSVNPEDERFQAKMTVLMELVQHHVEEEESEMFKLAEKLGKERLSELGEEMAERAGIPASSRARKAA